MSPAEGDRDPQRILIVDDEPAVREALQRSLAFDGYDTEVAVDGADALEKATAYKPDLVVLDIQMPRMDGLTAARRIRGAGDTTPILMLTARDTVGDRVTGLDAGADDYLTKPFELRELLARVRALVRRRPRERPARIELGGLVVDPATHGVTRDGATIDLTAREFALLEYLAEHAGEVVSRTTLLEHVWDANYMGSTNIVDVYVTHLRKKLERPFGQPLIRTVRGVGFVLDPES
jgi:two-component system, OmpR family, response regulator MprA